jgi:small GTP-binding protein
MGDTFKLKVKICLIGDSQVGKTSLIRRYVMDIFNDKYITTLGTKVSKKQLKIKIEKAEIDLIFSIWDVLGQKEFKKIQLMAFKGSKGALIVCDMTRDETLKNTLKWSKKLKAATGDIPMILLANKSDLTGDHAYTEAEVKQYSEQLNAPYFLTSAKFGDNVIKTFYTLGHMVTNEIFKDYS